MSKERENRANRIRERISKVLGVPFGEPYEMVRRCSALSNIEFKKLSQETRTYLSTMALRIKRNEEALDPEEYLKRKAIESAPTQLPPPTSRKRKGLTTHEIAKALVLAKGIIPSSYEIEQSSGLTKISAISLRRDLIFVLKVLAATGLYEHPTLEASIKYANLRKRPRKVTSV
jgi:hypothetical protein